MRKVVPLLLLLGGCSLLPSIAPRQFIDDRGITTTLDDAYPDCPSLDHRDLGDPQPLSELPRDEHGHIILKPGYYRQDVATY